MGNRYERKKTIVFYEFLAVALVVTIAIIKYFNLYNKVSFGWLIAIGFGITIPVYLLSIYLFFRFKFFKVLIILFVAVLWGVGGFYFMRRIMHADDASTWLVAMLAFTVTLLLYVHFHIKKIFR